MSASKGRNLLIKDSSGNTLAGLLARTISVENDVVDVTSGQDLWRQSLASAGDRFVVISGNVIFQDDVAGRLMQDLNISGAVDSFTVEFENGDTLTGSWMVTSFDYGVELGGVLTAAMTLDGAVESTLTRLLSNYGELVVGDNPVAYWRLGEFSGLLAVDEIGNAHGTHALASSKYAKDGAIFNDSDTAILYDVSLEFTKAQDPVLDIPGDLSVELWFMYDTAPDLDNVLISKRSIVASQPINYQMATQDSGVHVALFRGDDVSEARCTTEIQLDTWHHVVGTRAGGIHKIYFDGIHEGTSGPTTPIANSAPLTIGGHGDQPGFEANCNIDEVAVYNHILSDAEILEHYNLGKFGT